MGITWEVFYEDLAGLGRYQYDSAVSSQFITGVILNFWTGELTAGLTHKSEYCDIQHGSNGQV